MTSLQSHMSHPSNVDLLINKKIVDLFIKAISCDHYNLLVSRLILCNDLHQFEGECEESTNHSIPVEYEISTNLTLSR